MSLFHRSPKLDESLMQALGEIQETLLRPRPTPYWGTHLAFSIDTAEGGRELIKRLSTVVKSVATGQTDPNWTLVSLSFAGLQALELPQDVLDSFPREFKAGMKARAIQLRDVGVNAPEHWQAPFDEHEIHLTVSVFSINEQAWQEGLAKAKQQFEQLNGVSLITSTNFGGPAGEVNPFGYRDGFTFPVIKGFPNQGLNGQNHPIALGEFILGHPSETGVAHAMPQPEVLAKNSSFMVLRRYSSHLGAFNDFLRENGKTAEEQELLAAKLVGRWRSGAPLALAPEKDDPELGADDKRNNDFDYSDDPDGLKVPKGAHIRRVNPRQGKLAILTDVNVHRMIRNGTAFGPAFDPHATAKDDDQAGRGLFFMLISAKACETFEFLQKEWIENGNFQSLGKEKDPILGQHGEGDTFTIPKKPVRQRVHGIHTFNVLTGGEYLFVPSLPALKWLAEKH
jgi:Dyp-type peroxidase family